MQDINIFRGFTFNRNTMTDFLKRKDKFDIYLISKCSSLHFGYQIYNIAVKQKLSILSTDKNFIEFLKAIQGITFTHFNIKPIFNGYNIECENAEKIFKYKLVI